MSDSVKLTNSAGVGLNAMEHYGPSLKVSPEHVREIPLGSLSQLRSAMQNNKLDEVIVQSDDRMFLIYSDETDKAIQKGDNITLTVGDKEFKGKVLDTNYEFDTKAEKFMDSPLPEKIIAGWNIAAWTLIGFGTGTLATGNPGMGAIAGIFGGIGALGDAKISTRERGEARMESSALLNGLTLPVSKK
ncbi:hypothetical protein KAI87_04620 [Myxococcota bacterium]|nr:hypothetical protein [Myxococcota bacterium]